MTLSGWPRCTFAVGRSEAIGFYRRFGFEPDGAADVLPDWEDLPEIRMVRPAQR